MDKDSDDDEDEDTVAVDDAVVDSAAPLLLLQPAPKRQKLLLPPELPAAAAGRVAACVPASQLAMAERARKRSDIAKVSGAQHAHGNRAPHCSPSPLPPDLATPQEPPRPRTLQGGTRLGRGNARHHRGSLRRAVESSVAVKCFGASESPQRSSHGTLRIHGRSCECEHDERDRDRDRDRSERSCLYSRTPFKRCRSPTAISSNSPHRLFILHLVNRACSSRPRRHDLGRGEEQWWDAQSSSFNTVK